MKKTMITALLVVLGLIILGGGIYGITTVLSDNTIVGPKGDVGPTGPEGPIGPTGERGSTIWKRDITSNGNETISIPTPAVHNMRVGDLVITNDNYVYRIYLFTSSTILLTLEIAFNAPPEVPKWEYIYSIYIDDDEINETTSIDVSKYSLLLITYFRDDYLYYTMMIEVFDNKSLILDWGAYSNIVFENYIITKIYSESYFIGPLTIYGIPS